MLKLAAHFLFSLLLITCYLSLAVKPAFAQAPNYPQRDNHIYVQQVTLDVMAAVSCNLTGFDPSGPDPSTGEPRKCIGYDPKTGELGFAENSVGAIGSFGNLISMLYTPPLSSGTYIDYLSQNFGIAKPAYAQGAGFEGLSPLIRIWSIFRNLVYLLFAVAFVIVGFAIMLRVHIDPRTVMTIQNQIPKLIIALILVTFSFAIAGFMVDLMYVMIFLLFGIVAQSGISLGNFDPLSVQGKNPLEIFNEVVGFGDVVARSAGGVKDLVQSMFVTPNIISQSEGGTFIISGLWDAVTGGIRNAFGAIIAWLIGGVAFLIIAVAILWALFRLWFQLIMAYILFLLDVIFAPFWILAGIFPGSPIGFGAWLRSVLSNLSPFPATIGMFLIGKILIETVKSPSPTSPFFVPPLIGDIKASDALAAIIALGIILLTPQVVAIMKDLFKAPQFKYMPAIGQALGVGPSVVGGLVQAIGYQYGALATFSNFTKTVGGGFRGAIDVTRRGFGRIPVLNKGQAHPEE